MACLPLLPIKTTESWIKQHLRKSTGIVISASLSSLSSISEIAEYEMLNVESTVMEAFSALCTGEDLFTKKPILRIDVNRDEIEDIVTSMKNAFGITGQEILISHPTVIISALRRKSPAEHKIITAAVSMGKSEKPILIPFGLACPDKAIGIIEVIAKGKDNEEEDVSVKLPVREVDLYLTGCMTKLDTFCFPEFRFFLPRARCMHFTSVYKDLGLFDHDSLVLSRRMLVSNTRFLGNHPEFSIKLAKYHTLHLLMTVFEPTRLQVLLTELVKYFNKEGWTMPNEFFFYPQNWGRICRKVVSTREETVDREITVNGRSFMLFALRRLVNMVIHKPVKGSNNVF